VISSDFCIGLFFGPVADPDQAFGGKGRQSNNGAPKIRHLFNIVLQTCFWSISGQLTS